jgi:hypothetical protein
MERLEARLLHAATGEMRQGVINRVQLPIDAYVDSLGTAQLLADGSVRLQADIMLDNNSAGYEPAEPTLLQFMRGGDLDPSFGAGGIFRGAFGSDEMFVDHPERGVLPSPAPTAKPSPADPEPLADAYSDDAGVQFVCFNSFGGERADANGTIHSFLLASGDVCDPILLIDSSVTADGNTSTIQQWLFDAREPLATPSNLISGLDQRLVRRDDGSLIAFFGSDGADDLYVLDTTRLAPAAATPVEPSPVDGLPAPTRLPVDVSVNNSPVSASVVPVRQPIPGIARELSTPLRSQPISAGLFAATQDGQDWFRDSARHDAEFAS